jgi:hypothetical protein
VSRPPRRSPLVSVFIGTTDRLSTLERTVASYAHLTTPHELILVDNGTEHPACRALLDRLERRRRVAKVYRFPPCNDMYRAAAHFTEAIADWHDQGRGGAWTAVSEADVCFDGTPADALAVYIALAEELGTAVGPHLRVDQAIPVGYPLRSRVLACETWMLYRNEMEWSEEGVPFSRTQIDTTFHLFPRDRFFSRLHMDPVRVGPPYDAMHLDWYLDVFSPVPENAIYIGGERKVGSWGKQWLRDYWFWFQEHGPEPAWELLLREPMNLGDICNVSMIRSWALQYGVGVARDLDASRDWLRSAIPFPNPRYWDREADWLEFVYDGNMSALGWGAAEEVAA